MYIPMSITEINTLNRSATINTPNNSSVVTTASRSTTITPNRQAAINGLAVVGFIALVVAGIWLAVYSTRFVPTIVNRIGGAAVYLGSVFTPADEPILSVVPTPTASTTISFGDSSSTISTSTTPARTNPVKTTAGERTSSVYQIGGVTNTGVLSGLPDFVVSIDSVGYLASTSADSFVATSTMQSSNRPAVKFTVKNIGTNKSGEWRFSASIPTQSSYLYYSPFQQSLNPGDSIDYTLGFDQPIAGSNKMISVTANFDHAVGESNTNNNSASVSITIIGS